MKLKQKASVLLLPLFLCSQALGLEPETVVVTGTYLPTPEHLTTNPVFVIDRSRIDSLNKASVVEVLRTVPGVLVSQQGGEGGVTTVSIRGGEPNFTVVLVDGVQVNDSTNSRGGSYDFSNINVNSIERIEVIRGAQSAVYGSDALAGVINIITTSPTPVPRGRVNIGGGERGYYDVGVALQGTVNNLGYSANLQRLDSGEQVEGSEYSGTEFNGRLELNPSDKTSIAFNFRYVDSEKSSFPEQSGGPEYAQSRLLEHLSSDETSARFYLRQVLGAAWTTELDLSWFYRDGEQDSPGIVPFTAVPPNSSEDVYQRGKAAWVNSIALSPKLTLVLGLDGRFENGESEGSLEFFGEVFTTDYQLRRDTRGAFADFSYRASNGFIVNGSLRIDDPDDFDSESTGRLGLKLPMGKSGSSIFFNWGQGYKLPSFFALGNPLVGNPALQPERANSWDLGVEWLVRDRGMLRMSAFYNDYRDLIDFDEATFSNVNRDQVITQGAELGGRWQAIGNIDLRLNATFTDIEVVDTDRELAGRPRLAAGLGADWRWHPDWVLSMDYQWNDDVVDYSLYPGEIVQETLSAWGRLDANLRWRPTREIELALVINNVLDEAYQQAIGFPAPGRWLRLQGHLSF